MLKCLSAIVATLAILSSAAAGLTDLHIEWGKPVNLGRGGYARVHRLHDGRYMAAYELGGDMMARFSPPGNIDEWTRAHVVARHFTMTNGAEAVRVNLSNAEFAQLPTGCIIYATNLRPRGTKTIPYAIGITTSDDLGETWSPLKIVYSAEVAGIADAPSHGCGCWEPFVLPLGGNKARIFFANEAPRYRPGKCDSQEISCIETSDGGETWSKPRTVCYTPDCRDGMPVALSEGTRTYLAIEANPPKTRLHPQIAVLPQGNRFEPLANPPDWSCTYGGAPYIASTQNFLVLSWQESPQAEGNHLDTAIARVAVVPKKEIAPDGTFSTMRGVSTPPGFVYGEGCMLWNSLCPIGGDAFLLVSQIKGSIEMFPGRIKGK